MLYWPPLRDGGRMGLWKWNFSLNFFFFSYLLWLSGASKFLKLKKNYITGDLAASITSLQLAGGDQKTAAGNSKRRTFKVIRPVSILSAGWSAEICEDDWLCSSDLVTVTLVKKNPKRKYSWLAGLGWIGVPEMKVRLHYKHFKIDRRASHDFLSREKSIEQMLPCAVYSWFAQLTASALSSASIACSIGLCVV